MKEPYQQSPINEIDSDLGSFRPVRCDSHPLNYHEILRGVVFRKSFPDSTSTKWINLLESVRADQSKLHLTPGNLNCRLTRSTIMSAIIS